MKLIVGLGNPGRSYEQTRHNAGFRVVDHLAMLLGASLDRKKFKAEYGEAALPSRNHGPKAGDGRLLLAKPQTFMNLSGEAVRDLAGFYKIPREDLLVVVDDVSLPVGRLRLRQDGSAGGHNGLKDIERCLGSQAYARMRLGVGGREDSSARPAGGLAGHVLGRFGKEEEQVLAQSMGRAVEACLVWAGYGIADAMNRYNRTPEAEGPGAPRRKDETGTEG